MSEFKVGDKVRICVSSEREAEEAAHKNGWLYINCPGFCEPEMVDKDIYEVIPHEDPYAVEKGWIRIFKDAETDWLVIPPWIEHAEAPKKQECSCPLWQGCSCGAMRAEMEAKGKVYCTVTKMWVDRVAY